MPSNRIFSFSAVTRATVVGTFRIRAVSGSNLGSETDYTEGVCGFRQAFPGKHQDSIPNYTTNTSFHILPTSYDTNDPIIRR